MSAYPYCNGSLLDSPQNYMYTPYLGPVFVSDWHLSRSSYLTQYSCSSPLLLSSVSSSFSEHHNDSLSTEAILVQLCLDLRTGSDTSEHVIYWLSRLLKKFEVSKRLYRSYAVAAPHRMIVDSGFDNINLYLLLAESLIRAWAIKPMSQYINGLLKLVDTLLSQTSLLSKMQSSHLAWVIIAERTILDKVLTHLSLKKGDAHSSVALKCDSLSFLGSVQLPIMSSYTSSQTDNKNNDATLADSNKNESQKVLLLCGHTSRSVAYIQTLSAANIVPDGVIVYGTPKAKPTSARALNNISDCELFSPNLEIDVLQSLQRSHWQYSVTQANELNDPSLLALIEKFNPDLIIYSGYGGQLVPTSLLNNYPVLHIHSGWLPDYRGSTTLYYQIIDEQACAASAILLDEQIDTGAIVARKRYPIPAQGMDVDYLYDNMIRADLLVETLKQWRDPVKQWQVTPQTQDSLPYFIIHPLLKHLALLTVDKEKVDLC